MRKLWLSLLLPLLVSGCIFSPGQSGEEEDAAVRTDSGMPDTRLDDGGVDDGGPSDATMTPIDMTAPDAPARDVAPRLDASDSDATSACPNCGPCAVCNTDTGECQQRLNGATCDLDVADCQSPVCLNGECVAALDDGFCFIEDVCVELMGSAPENDCLVCNPSVSVDFWTPKPPGAECMRDTQCLVSQCDGAGNCVLHKDSATDDMTCSAPGRCLQGEECLNGVCICRDTRTAVCTDAGVTYAQGVLRPGAECEWCVGTEWVARPDYSSCQDGASAGWCMSGTCEPF